MKSIEGNFDNSEVNNLLKKHFIELRKVSPEGSTHVLDIEGLRDPSIKFWSLWENNELVGCGALKFLEKKHGEFKSIRVADKFRKTGVGKNNNYKHICLFSLLLLAAERLAEMFDYALVSFLKVSDVF